MLCGCGYSIAWFVLCVIHRVWLALRADYIPFTYSWYAVCMCCERGVHALNGICAVCSAGVGLYCVVASESYSECFFEFNLPTIIIR